MSVKDLEARIHRFREEYIDTAVGRAHTKTACDEAAEVVSIYDDVVKRRHSGEDITELTLKRLLPHSNTKGNKERGVRISTWPCITKDVRAWFEAAKWKKSEEWPGTANWLLDICEAGRNQDWTTWRSLAGLPLQKGFACGFITPIVHCLNCSLPVINSKVVKTYSALAEDLHLKTAISSALDEYPTNQQLILEMIAMLKDFGISDLLEFDIFCHWNVAKRLGGNVVVPPPKLPEKFPPSSVILGLTNAQHDTKNPAQFEATLAVAFQELGFETEHIGGAGEADVVATARIGDDSYSIVLDAKTCPVGSAKSNINYDPLKKHQEQHEADFAIVVASAFSQGDTVTHACNRSVGLLTTDCLISLLQESQESGVSLYDLKSVLAKTGLIPDLAPSFRRIRDDLLASSIATLEIFESHQRNGDSSPTLDSKSVYWILQGKGAKLVPGHVDAAIQFLSSPFLSVLEKKDDGFVLTLPAARASRRVISAAKVLAQFGSDDNGSELK